MVTIYIKKEIHEYDIASCDISVLTDNGFFDDKQYNYFKNLSKYNRVVKLGIMRGKDKAMGSLLKSCITNAVDNFIKVNDIEPTDIFEIVKDAVWLHRHVSKTKFGKYINFVCKNTATSLFVFNGIKFYYDSNMGVFFTRGIGKSTPKILEFIKDVMAIAEVADRKSLYNTIHKFKLSYVRSELDDVWYINEAFDNTKFIDAIVEDFIK